MKNPIYLFLCLFILLSGCNYLDVIPNEFVTDDDIWKDVTKAEKLVTRLYTVLDNRQGLDIASDLMAATDETKNHWGNPSVWKFNTGNWGPSDNPFDNWKARYEDIRIANLFINNAFRIVIPENKKDYWTQRIPRYTAECRMIRAWFYYELLCKYGPVPILTPDSDDGNVNKLRIPRSSVDELIRFLTDELDQSAAVLPESYDSQERGRVTRGAALALKAKVLLQAASPLLNGNPLYKEIRNFDGKYLFNAQYDADKWLKAAMAAKAVLDMADRGIYRLSRKYPDNPIASYASLFYTREYEETIFFKLRSSQTEIDKRLVPNGTEFFGNGKYSVSQEHIDAYEMNNGYPINEPGSGYDKTGFWDGYLFDGTESVAVTDISVRFRNRDPRFYASVFYQGAVWRFKSTRRQMHFAFWNNRNNQKEGWPKLGTNCESGYNIRKWCSPEVDLRNNHGSCERNYPIIRLAEMYLIYAEALNEYLDKPDMRVYQAVNAVRNRVNMPSLPIIPADYTKEGMRKRIQNEYRVEFAFENHRFFDVRRWLIAKTTDNGAIHGLNALPAVAEMDESGIMDESDKRRGLYPFYKEVVLQKRVFEDKHY
ncbi:MAG: RagB/SusD family nutrient uptake outer membrane protein, partial [Bacteroidales bacterium]